MFCSVPIFPFAPILSFTLCFLSHCPWYRDSQTRMSRVKTRVDARVSSRKIQHCFFSAQILSGYRFSNFLTLCTLIARVVKAVGDRAIMHWTNIVEHWIFYKKVPDHVFLFSAVRHWKDFEKPLPVKGRSHAKRFRIYRKYRLFFYLTTFFLLALRVSVRHKFPKLRFPSFFFVIKPLGPWGC